MVVNICCVKAKKIYIFSKGILAALCVSLSSEWKHNIDVNVDDFFFVFLNLIALGLDMFIFNIYMHEGYLICNRKPPSKFEIEALYD